MHKESYETYGVRRVKAQLEKDGIKWEENRAARLMRENGIYNAGKVPSGTGLDTSV